MGGREMNGVQTAQLSLTICHNFPGGGGVDINFNLNGMHTVLFGPSGAGKTTILRCISGLMKPDGGSIRFGDETWFDSESGLFVPPQKRRVGYLFQNYALFDHMNVRDNIGYALDRVPPKERNEKTDRMLELFNLAGMSDRMPQNLSGGEKQRVALARTLCADPELLLLDEPLSALDTPSRKSLRKELRKVIKSLGVPVLVVTHDRTEALTLGEEIVIMDGGKVLQQGSIDSVFSRPADRRTADIVGVENIFSGKVIGSEDGIVKVEAGGALLSAVSEEGTPGSVMVCIRADEITLEKSDPRATSARNRLKGKIASFEKEGTLVSVLVDCGVTINVLITNKSFVDLGLAKGDEVQLSIKAQSIHLFPQI